MAWFFLISILNWTVKLHTILCFSLFALVFLKNVIQKLVCAYSKIFN